MNRQSLAKVPRYIAESDIIWLKNEKTGDWTYRFKTPQEIPGFPGFFHIPEFLNYGISREGVLISLRNGRLVNWGMWKPGKKSATGGYRITNIRHDSGIRKGVKRHRLVLMVFTEYDFHPATKWVNHKDGIPGHDTIENLEWVTPSENLAHAYATNLMSGKVVRVVAQNWKTKVELCFPSIQKAAESLSLKHSKIQGRMLKGSSKRHKDGWRFKTPEQNWEPLNDLEGSRECDRAVIGRDVFNGRNIIFSSIVNASEMTGLKPGVIQSQCSREPRVPFKKWQFRYLDKFSGWPIKYYSERHLELFKKQGDDVGDGIIVNRIEDGKEVFFGTIDEAAKWLGLSPITVRKLARYEGTRHDLKFSLFKVR